MPGKAASSSGPRPRSQLEHGDLVSLLEPFVASRLWISYSTRMNSPVDRAALKKFAPLLSELKHSLNQKPLMAALETILDARGGFQLSGCQREDWSSTCALRLRVAHRHWKDAERRGCAWWKKIAIKESSEREGHDKEQGTSTEEKQDMRQGEKQDQTHDEKKDDFYYGFCKDQWRAWRADSTGAKVFADAVFVKDEEEGEDDFVYARWQKNGVIVDEQKLTDLRVGEYLATSEAHKRRLASTTAERFFDSVLKTGERIIVRTRKDRPPHSLLLSMQVDGKQRGSVHADAFESTEKAGAFLSKIAQMVVDEKIGLDDVYAVRDRLLVDEGITVVRKRPAQCMKRPAALISGGEKQTRATEDETPDEKAKDENGQEDEPVDQNTQEGCYLVRKRKKAKRIISLRSKVKNGKKAKKGKKAKNESEKEMVPTPGQQWHEGEGREVRDEGHEREEGQGRDLDVSHSEVAMLRGFGVGFFDNPCEPIMWD